MVLYRLYIYLYRKLVFPWRCFFHKFPLRSVDRYQQRKDPYCHISNTPFFGGVFERHVGVFGCKRWNRGWILFYVISRHFWMEFPLPRDFQKHNQQPRSAPHVFYSDVSVPSPDGRIFITTALFQLTKMKGDVTNNLVSRGHCSQLAAE
jgi:hypothetical protein